MLKLLKLLVAIAGLCFALAANASVNNDTIACSVAVSYSLNGTERLRYDRDFVVGVNSPYDEDLSTRFRFGFFNASVVIENSTPVVSINFDRDVSVFNEVFFNASLKVRDRRNGDKTSGSNQFNTSTPSTAGSHKTDYTLTCKRVLK